MYYLTFSEDRTAGELVI